MWEFVRTERFWSKREREGLVVAVVEQDGNCLHKSKLKTVRDCERVGCEISSARLA